MKSTTLALACGAAAALTSACGANDLRLAVPEKGDVSLNVPGAESNGQALLGATSGFYETARDIARQVNGTVGAVFDISEAIIRLPPTDTDGETYAVWGPSEPRGLERNSFRFTVNKVAEGEFDYKLEARNKDATEEADFAVIWEGTSFPVEGSRGHGTLDIHWGALRSLDDTSCLVGDLHVDYAADEEPKRVDVTFVEIADGCRDQTPTNASYFYAEAQDGAGQMDFAFQKDLHNVAEAKPLEEIFAVRARWLADGAGRADVRVSEGEIPADLAANIPGTTSTSADLVQCWDASFNVTYQDTNPDELEPHLNNPEEGDAAACAFADASFAEL